MKKSLFLILICFSVLSCSNDDDNSQKTNLVGDWMWISSSGGLEGTTETPESTGKTMELKISENTIKKYVNGNLQFESNYSIEFENNNGEQIQIIKYEDQIINLQIISLTQNTLKLRDYNISDGFQYKYSRE